MQYKEKKEADSFAFIKPKGKAINTNNKGIKSFHWKIYFYSKKRKEKEFVDI